jgi:hypothetical protein
MVDPKRLDPKGADGAEHPDPSDPQHKEWLIDEASAESFPASDPSSVSMPHPSKPPEGNEPSPGPMQSRDAGPFHGA